MTPRIQWTAWLLHAAATAAMAACGITAHAQGPAATAQTQASSTALNLRQLFEAAWARQPEALALQARRDAARSEQAAAKAWTPEPAALELSHKTDRLNRDQGARELELGVAVPLWLPGERQRSAALADAQATVIESHATAAQLRLAAAVREAWWQWQHARIEAGSARDQLGNARRLGNDVARRTAAGDLARADQHQADGAVASAEANLAQAEGELAAAWHQLRALAGTGPASGETAGALPEPEPGAAAADPDAHPALQVLKDRATVAERAAALASSQSRAHPELVLATTRNRSAVGEAVQQTITLGVRIPFGSGPRTAARTATARAEVAEAQAQLALERARVTADRAAAAVRVSASRSRLAAAERRARLAHESRGFFDKSFRLGETDLPTRLRVEAEAADADRQLAHARTALAAALSTWRQALGLLPQ